MNNSKIKTFLDKLVIKFKLIKPSNKSLSLIITLFITLITLFISFNQIVQPVIFPRVESFTITPLYIQSCCNPNNPDFSYYKVFKISYIIEPPLLYENTNIILRLPNSNYDGYIQPNSINILTDFKQVSPYSEILLEDNKQPEDIIKVSIKPNGNEVKSVTVDLYFRQKLDDYSDARSDYWWSQSTIIPEFPVIQTYRNDVIGSFFFDKDYFEVHKIILQNKNNYEIRNLKFSIEDDQSQPKVFCYKEDSPIPIEYENYLMFDVVLPEEKSSLLYFKKLSNIPRIETPNYNLTTLDCSTVMKMFSQNP